jgi:hypothetical protein
MIPSKPDLEFKKSQYPVDGMEVTYGLLYDYEDSMRAWDK